MRVLVTAASRHGATHEIADAIASGLEHRGLDADAHHEELTSLDDYCSTEIEVAIEQLSRAAEIHVRERGEGSRESRWTQARMVCRD